MDRNVLEKTNKYKEQNKRKRRHNIILRILGCAVVFCTVYALILPAITMEKDVPKELICTLETIGVHTHSDQCYDLENNNNCGYSDYVVHTHDELCYDTLGEIKCTLPVVETHTHTDSCYETVVITEESKLTDEASVEEKLTDEESADEISADEDKAVGDEASADEDKAVSDETTTEEQNLEEDTLSEKEPQIETKLICEKAEIILHKHNEECYDDNAALTCEMLEVLEHKHLDTCFKEIEQEEQQQEEQQQEEQQEEQQQEEQQDNINQEQNNILSEQDIDAGINAVGLDEGDEGEESENQDINLLADVPSNAVYVTSQNNLQSEINKGTSYIALGGDFGVYIKDSEGAGYGSLSGSLVIPSGKNITLDLNGHTIWQHGSDALFRVGENSTLNIVDSKAPTESVTYPGGNVVANKGSATLNNGTVNLTYYVTDSDINNNSIGSTTETLEKHTLSTKGAIISNDQITFNVTGGTLNIQSGMIYGGSNYAIRQTSGTTNVDGGYICGFTTNKDGGAVYTSGGRLSIDDYGVIAVNSGLRGGGIYATNTDVDIEGGVIASNISSYSASSYESSTHYGGGGICTNNGTLDMTGGYITNNYVTSKGYFDGGGGILACGNCVVTIKDGYITGNEASSGGGIRTNWKNSIQLEIIGGYICSNIARTSEGGGIAVNMNGTGIITGGYINNNATNSNSDWGGGGIFCSSGSWLYIRNALIADNHAGGFGGGVAGCSTGRTYLFVKQGAAVYDNSADGKNMSGATSSKNEDHIYAENNEVFMNNGYQDYFCALNSVVEGGMLGGHAAGWHGSADGVPVKANKEDTLVAAYIMGLSSEPAEQGKLAAQELAKVYINGNASYTHGGGILCNGYMIVGETDNIDLGARIELKAHKEYLNSVAETVELEEGQFTFEVVDAKTDAVLATASNDQKGAINFKERLSFTSAGQFVYYIREVKGDDSFVSYDGTVYRLTVDIEEKRSFFDEVLINGDTVTIMKTEYLLDKILVEKKNGTSAWETVSVNDNPSNSDSSAITLELTAAATFTNIYQEKKNIEVVKEWDDNDSNNRPTSVTVDLLRNGTVYKTVTLNQSNGWHYIWNDLDVVDGNGNQYKYTVKERPVNGYITNYEEITENALSGYWVPATSIVEGGKYVIVDPNRTQALYVPDSKADAGFSTAEKTAVTTETITFGGKTYQYSIPESKINNRNIFRAELTTSNDNKRIVFKNLGTTSTSLLLAQEANGNYLKGTSGAAYASGVKLENGKIRIQENWDKNNTWRYLSYEGGKFTTNTSGSNTARLYQYMETSINSLTTYKIVNKSVDTVDFTINITKVSASNNKMTLAGAEFNLMSSANGEPLYFVIESPGVYNLVEPNTKDATQTLVTNSNGKLVLQKLKGGDYLLRETKAPTGYQPIEDMNITLGSADNNGDISLVVRKTIEDNVIQYKLPETGGTGTILYTIGGTLLILLAAILLCYNHRKSGKEDYKTS